MYMVRWHSIFATLTNRNMKEKKKKAAMGARTRTERDRTIFSYASNPGEKRPNPCGDNSEHKHLRAL